MLEGKAVGEGEASEGEARRALRREQHSGEVEKEM